MHLRARAIGAYVPCTCWCVLSLPLRVCGELHSVEMLNCCEFLNPMKTCLHACMPVCLGPCPVPASVCVVLAWAFCVCVPSTLLRVLSLCLRVGFVLHLVDIAVSFPAPQLVVVHKGSPIVSRSP
mmetsp:Transcript_101631/g.163872  ORF Transcript_101631/g.163872 Transcript_101631/m.163872 type:complete len:125 (+) Transcript_101631:69-443(+)